MEEDILDVRIGIKTPSYIFSSMSIISLFLGNLLLLLQHHLLNYYLLRAVGKHKTGGPELILGELNHNNHFVSLTAI